MTKRLLAVLPLVAVMACAGAAPTVQRSDASPAIAPPGAGSAESVVVESRDLSAIDEAVRVGGSARTLLVLDIDDTLLTSETFFGSDSWYEWQKTLKPGDPGLVPCRFDVIALNYEAGPQRATEAGGPQYINGLTLPSLLLASRNSLYRAATTRELHKAGYSRRPSLGGEEFLAYSWQKDVRQSPSSSAMPTGSLWSPARTRVCPSWTYSSASGCPMTGSCSWTTVRGTSTQ